SDIFSLGVILYECITGATPFNGEGLSALMYQITNHDPAPPSSSTSQVPRMLDYIIAKALTKTTDGRSQTPADLANDLRGCSAHNAPSSPRPSTAPAPVRQVPASPAAAAPLAAKPSAEPSDEAASAESPTKCISRSFDSQGATQRVMRQIGADGSTEFVST